MDSSDNQDEPPAEAVQIYSIGHSDHSMEAFLGLLQRHQIAVLVDVRSQPYSQWVPQFNRENLTRYLQAASVDCVFMGDTLGGRPASRDSYSPGEEHPDYELIRKSPAFQAGLQQLLALAATGRTVIMCAEGDFHKCHRGKLITPSLLQAKARVFHIGPDGSIEEARPEPKQLSLL
jgi:uncharacterized protein (DUF488 family)